MKPKSPMSGIGSTTLAGFLSQASPSCHLRFLAPSTCHDATLGYLDKGQVSSECSLSHLWGIIQNISKFSKYVKIIHFTRQKSTSACFFWAYEPLAIAWIPLNFRWIPQLSAPLILTGRSCSGKCPWTIGVSTKNNSVIYKFVMLVFYRSHYYNGIHYYKTNHVIIMGSIGGKKKCCFIIIGIYIRDLSLVQLFNFKPGTSQVVVSEILDLQIWKKICGEPYCSSCEVYEAWVSTMFNDPKFLWNIHQWLINSQPLLGLEGVAKNYSKNERFPTWWISRRENPTNRKPNPG
jgi:hypothetical protein